jgi:hypothetical protein
MLYVYSFTLIFLFLVSCTFQPPLFILQMVSDAHVDPTKTHTAGIKFNVGGISQGNFVKKVM